MSVYLSRVRSKKARKGWGSQNMLRMYSKAGMMAFNNNNMHNQCISLHMVAVGFDCLQCRPWHSTRGLLSKLCYCYIMLSSFPCQHRFTTSSFLIFGTSISTVSLVIICTCNMPIICWLKSACPQN